MIDIPLISVIVPVYNVEIYLETCILSITNQTYENLEIILIDDGSTDSCPAICDKWSENDRRIKVIHKKNGGLSDARNAGLDWSFDQSNCEWITFIDSDDFVHEMYLESLSKYIDALESSSSVEIVILSSNFAYDFILFLSSI